jgi:hypothetical protein
LSSAKSSGVARMQVTQEQFVFSINNNAGATTTASRRTQTARRVPTYSVW